MGVSSKLKEDEFLDVTTTRVSSRPKKNQEINMGGVDVKPVSLRRPPLPPPLLPPVEEVSVSSIMPADVTGGDHSSRSLDLCSLNVSAFTIASLQQYTNSFAEENFIGEGLLGGVYRAELPDGKVNM